MASSEHTTSNVSSAYCEIRDKESDDPGRQRPLIRVLALMLQANTSATRTYQSGVDDSPGGHHGKERRTETSNH